MSSSYVEVREAENGTEENALPIAIDTCESNGIVAMNQIDGEPQKDHTYNKEPLEVQGEVEVLMSSEDAEDTEVSIKSPEKPKRGRKKKGSAKKSKVAQSPVKKESPKKTASPKKKVAAKETEDKPETPKKEEEEEEKASVSDSEDKLDGSVSEKDSPLTKKRGQKRKAEDSKTPEMEPKPKKEKLDTKKGRPVKSKEVKKDEEEEKELERPENNVEKTDVSKEVKEKLPPKPDKQNLKSSKKTANGDDDTTPDDVKLPEGWTRKVVQRKSGKTAGQFDVYIYSPDGKKLRSRPDIAAYLAKNKSPLTLDDFSFSVKQGSGAHSTLPVKKSTSTPAKMKSTPKATNLPGKRKTAANNTKKGVRLVVKLNFSPKKRILSNYEEQKKTEKTGAAKKSEGGKRSAPRKSPAKKQRTQAQKKIPAKQTSSQKKK